MDCSQSFFFSDQDVFETHLSKQFCMGFGFLPLRFFCVAYTTRNASAWPALIQESSRNSSGSWNGNEGSLAILLHKHVTWPPAFVFVEKTLVSGWKRCRFFSWLFVCLIVVFFALLTNFGSYLVTVTFFWTSY